MTTYVVSQSAELMENYLQADILQPQKSFTALQTDTGASLLFMIGTDNVFTLIDELDGKTHGWARHDLSSVQAKADFPNGATCKTFGAAQHPAVKGSPAAIQLAMVLNDGTNDHLYVCLGNSDADLGWATSPAWVAAPFNAEDSTGKRINPPAPFEIAGIFISEATDQEYVVVDILRDPTDPRPLISRYYLDLGNPAAPVWTSHDLAIDLEAANYDSRLGRNDHSFGVDGLYTMGTVDASPELIYTPLYNPFNPSIAPSPARLLLASGATAEGIAAVRNSDNSSDLYAVAGDGLYYFAAANQRDKAIGPRLLTHPLLSGIRELFAAADGDRVTVWGLNGSDQVIYLSCDRASVGTGGAWSMPLPILTGVDAISPYIDRKYSANTFFAHAADALLKAVKDPRTGLWRRTPITLPPFDTTAAATKISSYTTRIQVSGATGQGVANVPVTLKAAGLTSVYINHLYYRIGPDPIMVQTDVLGSITIVEAVHTLAATQFTATVDQQDLAINPMDAPFQRNARLDSVDKLSAAVITDRDGTTRPFIPAGTSQSDLKAVAQSNQGLANAYNRQSGLSGTPFRLSAAGGAVAIQGIEGGILSDLGDLFSWIESGIEAVVSIVEDAAGEVWHFVAKIADAVYYGVLDAVEKIVAAALWVYNAIKVIIEDIILFLEFLFGWQDILATHRVFRNVLIHFAQSGIDHVEDYKAALPGLFAKLQSEINGWADIPPFGQTPRSSAAANPPPAGQHSAPAHLGVHHFQNNAANGSSSFIPVGPAKAIFQDLVDLFDEEGATLLAAIDAVKADVIDKFDDLSVEEIIKKILAILADTVIQSIQNVLVALLDVLAQIATGILDVLTATIDIPVLSWLYRELTGDDLSLLDLVCLIAAIPVTLVYKIASDKTPYPHDAPFTKGLIAAQNFDQVRAQFLVSAELPDARTDSPPALVNGSAVLDQDKLKLFGFTTGILSLMGSIILVVVGVKQREADAQSDDDPPAPDPVPDLDDARLGVSKTLLGVAACGGNVLYVSPNLSTLLNADEAPWYGQINNVCTCISLLKGVGLIFAAESSDKIKTTLSAVETILNTIWNIPVIANIIVSKDAYDTTYKSLIPESIGNFAFNLGGMLDWPIAVTEDPETKAGEIVVQSVLMVSYGVASTVAGGIYAFADDQHH